MVADLETVRYQLYERRLDACLTARNNCVEDSWGWTYWQRCFTILLNKMNRELNESRNQRLH